MTNRDKRKGPEQEEELDLCTSDGSLTESTLDMDSDYIPESMESSDDEDMKIESSLKKTVEQQEPDTSPGTSCFADAHKHLVHTNEDNRDSNSECNADTEDDVQSSGVTVKTCVKGEKRKWDKKHYCVYCKTPQSKMARHLIRKHSDEKEVATAICLPIRSKKRGQILEQLRRKGDYYHNITVLEKGHGEIVTYRQPSQELSAEDYLPCSICYGFFIKVELWRHQKTCRQTISGSAESKKQKVQCAASALLPYRGQPSERCAKIMSRMVIDKVSSAVKNDPLICEYGDRLLERHGSDSSKDGHVSQKMRELGRFLISAKSLNQKIKKLQDILVPPNFSLAVAAAKEASGFAKSKYRYDAPSLALKLGHSLKAVCDIAIGQYIKAEDEAAANRVRNFSGLLAAEWDLYVSRRARTNLEEGKWNKKDMIPLTEDVKRLHQVLKSTEAEAKEKLLEGPDPKAFKTLTECLLSQIILFNRRRQGEAAKMALHTYKDRAEQEPNADIMQCLSKLEQDLSYKFTRLVIRGKRGRKVPVLLTKEMTASLDFLIQQRSEDNGILTSNEYVFARQNSESYLRGSDCLRKYAAACGAARPETLTSTQLRKHVATLSQIMNLKENELDQLAKFMGHDIRVHREYYRLTENTLQLAKISKLLLAVERGAEVYKGKSLDEIDLDLEIDLPANVEAVHKSAISQSDADTSSEQCFESAQELDGPRMMSQRPTTSTSSDEGKRTESSKSTESGRLFDPDSDDPQQTCTKQHLDMLNRREKTEGSSKKKQRKRTWEKAHDSDVVEDPDILRQKSTTAGLMEKTRGPENSGTKPQILNKKTFLRRPWNSKEKAAVWRQLGQYITLRRVPGKEPCLKALKSEPVLGSRSWKDIKNQVYNSIVAEKKKRL